MLRAIDGFALAIDLVALNALFDDRSFAPPSFDRAVQSTLMVVQTICAVNRALRP